MSRGARKKPHLQNEAPRSSLLRLRSHFGYEGRKLRGILQNSPKPLPSFAKATEGSPRLHPRSSLLRRSSRFGYEGRKLRGIRRRRIMQQMADGAEAPCMHARPNP